MTGELELTERQKELRLKWRGELELLSVPFDVTVPSDVVARKSKFYAIELDGFLPIETAWQLIRDAIDDALAQKAKP